MDIPRVDVLVCLFLVWIFFLKSWVLSFRVLTFFVFYSVSLDIEKLGFAIRKVHFLSTVMLIGSPLVKTRPKTKCTCLHLTERPKRLQMSLPAPRWCKFRDSEAIWISQSLQQILCWRLFPLEPIRTVSPVAFPSMATVELLSLGTAKESLHVVSQWLCAVLRRYQHAVANPGLITFTGPYLDVGGAGYVVTISHTIHASRWEHWLCLGFFFVCFRGWGVKHRMCYILLHQSKSQVKIASSFY